MGGSELTEFPAGILKICHLICNLAVVICLAVAKWASANMWFILMTMMLVVSLVVIICIICGQNSKEWLLVNYSVGFSFAFACLVHYSEMVFYWKDTLFICSWVFTFLGGLTYLISLLLNVMKGQA